MPAELLESGRDEPGAVDRLARRLPPRAVRGLAAAGTVAALVAGAALAWPSDGSSPAAAPAGPPAGAPAGPAGPAAEVGALDELPPTGLRVLLAGDRATALDVDGRRVEPLGLPRPYDASAAVAVLPLRDADVVLAAPPPGEMSGRDALAVSLPRDPGARPQLLGPAHAVLPAADRSGVWLLAAVRGGEEARLHAPGGGPVLVSWPVPGDRELVAAVPDGLVVTGFDGPVEVRDPTTRALVRTVTPRGAALDAVGDRVAWSECREPTCRVQVTDLRSGETAPLTPPPGGLSWTGSLRLSPDGRHHAALVADRNGALSVLIGHAPGTPYADRASLVAEGLRAADRPALHYGDEGWLVVDPGAGQELLAVRPGPHDVAAVPVPVPARRGLGVR